MKYNNGKYDAIADGLGVKDEKKMKKCNLLKSSFFVLQVLYGRMVSSPFFSIKIRDERKKNEYPPNCIIFS